MTITPSFWGQTVPDSAGYTLCNYCIECLLQICPFDLLNDEKLERRYKATTSNSRRRLPRIPRTRLRLEELSRRPQAVGHARTTL